MVSDYFDGKVLNKSVNPDEAVAYGAAIQAAMLTGQGDNQKTNDFLMLDIHQCQLGIREDPSDPNSRMIRRNTCIPSKQIEHFTTFNDNQTEMEVFIFDGIVNNEKEIAVVKLECIQEANKGEPKIEVYFDIDANQSISVVIQEKTMNIESRAFITKPASALTKA